MAFILETRLVDMSEYDELLRRLTALVVKLDSTYDELREFNRQQVITNARVATTLERLETLMQRVFEQRHNGQEQP